MQFKMRALSAMPRLTAALGLIGMLVAGTVGYAVFVGGQKQYLESRNFRLLRALASQLDSAIGNEARVFESLARDPDPKTWEYFRKRRYRGADLPETLKVLCDPAASHTLVAGAGGQFFVEVQLTHPHATSAAQSRRLSPSADDGDSREADCSWETPRPMQLPLGPIVEPIVKPKLAQGAFDTIAVASQDGVTWFAAGQRAVELKSARLDVFVLPAGKDAPKRTLADLVHSTVIDMTIGGVSYRLFTQPCCGVAGERSLMVIGLVESDVLRARSWAISTTVIKVVVIAILLALVAWPFLKLALLGDGQRVRAFDVLQVAVSSVAALALLTMTALDFAAYWRLNSDRDAQLGALADAVAVNFESEIRQASKQLACLEAVAGKDRVADMLVRNIHYANGQCTGDLREVATEAVTPTSAGLPAGSIVREHGAPGEKAAATVAASAAATAARGNGSARALPSADWPYPWFESLSLIDESGRQRVKLATTRWVPSLIQVGARRYFTDVVERRAWEDDEVCPNGCVLEPVWSWTSGEPLAVLSTRARNGAYAVAALSIPMRSVMRPILPPGFQFAVIDDSGTVLFHSDRHRNGLESFFSETDDNRRLRAQVTAHSSEPLDLRYWGAPYRAFVRPLQPFNLSVIALFEKEQAWALNREWLVVALLLLGGYLVVCLIALILGLAWDASWLWPDVARRRHYVAIAIVQLLLLLAFAAICVRGQGTSLVWAGYLLPMAAWAVTFVMLWRRPSPPSSASHAAVSGEAATTRAASAGAASAGASVRAASVLPVAPAREPVLAHAVAFGLVLIVSGVVPGALLFLASFQLHVQSYLKHSDFRLVRALGERERRLDQEWGNARGKARETLRAAMSDEAAPDRYYAFFYGTRVEQGATATQEAAACVDAPSSPADARGGGGRNRGPGHASGQGREPGHRQGRGHGHGDEADHDLLLGLLEAYLPYYAESSVEWRELLHERAGDRSWRSGLVDGDRLALTVCPRRSASLTVTTELPSLLGQRPPARELPVEASRGVIEAGMVPAAAGPRQDSGPDVLSLLALLAGSLGILYVAYWMMRFLAREIFLAGVTDPFAHRSRRPASPASGRRTHEPAGPPDARVADDSAPAIDRRRVIAHPSTWPGEVSRQIRDVKVSRIERLLSEEGRSDPQVRIVCERIAQSDEVRHGWLSREQVFEALVEQASPRYRRLWHACTDHEKLLIAHLAQDGWANVSNRTVVRRLLDRRLLRKDPDLRLMNESFRQFVLLRPREQDVLRLESATELSPWDRLRLPFAIMVIGVSTFLFVTQKELYNAIIGVTSAAAVSVPTLVRAVGMLAGRRTAAADDAPKAA